MAKLTKLQPEPAPPPPPRYLLELDAHEASFLKGLLAMVGLFGGISNTSYDIFKAFNADIPSMALRISLSQTSAYMNDDQRLLRVEQKK